MPKHSSGNFKNSNNNISSDHHQQQQPQNFPQPQDQHRGGTHLSYENLSSTVPSGGAHSTNPMYFHQPQNTTHENHQQNALTAQQINPVAHHQLTAYASIHQKSNQALNHIQQSESSNHYGSFGNINSAAAQITGRVVSGGVISSGVSSSSTTSLDETQNGAILSSQQQTGSRNNINNSNTNLNNDQCMSADQVALPEGWDMGRDYDGKIYFIDHRSQTTTWVDPRERYNMHLLILYHGIYKPLEKNTLLSKLRV